MAANKAKTKKNKGNTTNSNDAMQNIMETTHLDMTLTKVGGLLALGFGEAGSEIIA